MSLISFFLHRYRSVTYLRCIILYAEKDILFDKVSILRIQFLLYFYFIFYFIFLCIFNIFLFYYFDF